MSNETGAETMIIKLERRISNGRLSSGSLTTGKVMAWTGLGDRDKLIEDLLDSSTNPNTYLAMGLNDFGKNRHCLNDLICLIA